MRTPVIFMLALVSVTFSYAQSISEFISIEPVGQSEQFVIPSTHTFQKIISTGDMLTEGGELGVNPDFSAYVPIANSSSNGYLSINLESSGGVTVLDINFNFSTKLWETNASEALDFSAFVLTTANCSGVVTSWNTVVSCEEVRVPIDINSDGYNDLGWNVEVDPVNKIVLNKLWAMGNFAHENITVHQNQRTAYQGADSDPGYLYKFVADTAQNLNSGDLYVYAGSKNGAGSWIQLQNSTPEQCNSTLAQSAMVNATVFDGIEDVEIGPDGMVYLAVKSEDQVYRFQDSDPLTGMTATMETFVGNTNYDISHASGTTSVPWGNGNDNLAFDGEGNLWVYQDGANSYIWVVENGHTQTNPLVRIFGSTPIDAEPTGITFSPDFNFLFMSIQHPSDQNNANQIDAAGNSISFDTSTTLVIALNGNLGGTLTINEIPMDKFLVFPNPLEIDKLLEIRGAPIKSVNVFSITGKSIKNFEFDGAENVSIDLNELSSGSYLLRINNEKTIQIMLK
ncbi:MAG: alkaline phosphatase PhoX [Psychroserpens sp.]|uniref:alkaline phosphatase PhoX n=1 Tax=Psychroserpens sp. TaxID=2020870 RepID=UPI0030034CCB